MRSMFTFLSAGCLSLTLILPHTAESQQQDEREKESDTARQEESRDYFEQWLNKDVVYIISDEEKAVFEKLTTPEEKERFIEQFWYRRDPDPKTSANEVKEEHYRRIAYANERFTSGISGWLTDRGRIYIIHGPPDQIESYPSGGTYSRPIYEGGGTTATYPFEIWRYRNIPGVGEEVILEFVDPSMAGEYRLARSPDEKDALLYVGAAGPTLAEQMGFAEKKDRPFFSPGNRGNYPLMHTRYRDDVFLRYEMLAKVQGARPVKYQDLKQIVDLNVTYSNLPFDVRVDFFRLNENRILVPVTIQLENKNLTYGSAGGNETARVGVYGLVTSMTNQIVSEFEHDLVASRRAESLEADLLESSAYQELVYLETGNRYKLSLVLKDLNSGQVGVVTKALMPPRFSDDRLSSSTVLLSSAVRDADVSSSGTGEMFVLGDLRIRPSIGKRFSRGESLGIYFHLYNAGLDQTSMSPSLKIVYRLLRNGVVLREIVESAGESIRYVSPQRIVLLKKLNTLELPLGRYQLQVEVEDTVQNQDLFIQENFRLES